MPKATARSEATGGYVFPYSLIFTTIAVSQCQILIGQKDSKGRLGAVEQFLILSLTITFSDFFFFYLDLLRVTTTP